MAVANTERKSVPRVLVVDDEEDIRELLEMTLIRMGLDADCAGSVHEAQLCLAAHDYQLCLTDMRLPDGEGLEILQNIAQHYPHIPVAVITAYGSTDNAVAALKAGAFDYLAKPVSLDHVRTLIKSAIKLPKPSDTPLGSPKNCSGENGQLIGVSAAMNQVRQMIGKLARSQAPVYISGESGSGKEMAARLIHQQSARRDSPFIPVNCGALPEHLVESEFFGYRKGAFTGADGDRDGFFQAAHGGTLFLDEVADLPFAMQVKLLRAIQEKKVRKVGSTVEEPVDIRILSATHRNLAECVDQGKFRQDLFYRLNVIELKMPALRERQEDIPLLVDSLLKKMWPEGPVPALSDDAMLALCRYGYPGNVRELENILERASALCGDEGIFPDDLQLDCRSLDGENSADSSQCAEKEPLDELMSRVERGAILNALEKTGFNRTAAARLLGVTFRSLRYRIERLGLDEEIK